MSTAIHPLSSPFLSSVGARIAGWFASSKPALARPLTPREQADQLRAMADDLIKSDPAFAQDLYAAADRHELKA